MTFTLADIVHLLTIVMVGGGLFVRIGSLQKTISQLEKAFEKIDPHVDLVPVMQRDLERHEKEIGILRERSHKSSSHIQWLLTIVEERAGRPPMHSAHDLDYDNDSPSKSGKNR